jgi:Zn finger protein HypA/HybF involved in hydrogenase expression
MHEVSLVQALFDQADRAILPHPSADVRQVTVCIGALAGVEGALFRSAFEGCKDERGYGNASLVIVELPSGDDLILQRLELETGHV